MSYHLISRHVRLKNKDTGVDLRAAKKLLGLHKSLDKEKEMIKGKIEKLVAEGAKLKAENHFDEKGEGVTLATTMMTTMTTTTTSRVKKIIKGKYDELLLRHFSLLPTESIAALREYRSVGPLLCYAL